MQDCARGGKTDLVTECTHCGKRYSDSVRFCPVDGFAVVPVSGQKEPMLGRLLMGQFQIEAICGHGATGTVYRAVQQGMDRPVAVKVLRADLVRDPDVVKRFVREARAGAKLSHPNIATVHLVGQTDEQVPFLVMELVDGPSLAALLPAGQPMKLSRIVHIATQIASALSEAHAHDIVHRDLKPENILITERRGEPDIVKVVDFGIAKILATTAPTAAPGEDAISRLGTVFGTPHYIAPEQASGQTVDGRADLYSLGCILYQMATGHVPFEGQTGLQVLLSQVREPIADPRRVNPRISDDLATLINALLQKSPARRPQTAEEVAGALQSLSLDAKTSAARPASGPAPTPTAVPASGRAAGRASGRPTASAARPQSEESRQFFADSDQDDESLPPSVTADRESDEDGSDVPVAARSRASGPGQRPARSGRPPASGAGSRSRAPERASADDHDDDERTDLDAEQQPRRPRRPALHESFEDAAASISSDGLDDFREDDDDGLDAKHGREAKRVEKGRTRRSGQRRPASSAAALSADLPIWQRYAGPTVAIGGAIVVGLLFGLWYARVTNNPAALSTTSAQPAVAQPQAAGGPTATTGRSGGSYRPSGSGSKPPALAPSAGKKPGPEPATGKPTAPVPAAVPSTANAPATAAVSPAAAASSAPSVITLPATPSPATTPTTASAPAVAVPAPTPPAPAAPVAKPAASDADEPTTDKTAPPTEPASKKPEPSAPAADPAPKKAPVTPKEPDPDPAPGADPYEKLQ